MLIKKYEIDGVTVEIRTKTGNSTKNEQKLALIELLECLTNIEYQEVLSQPKKATPETLEGYEGCLQLFERYKDSLRNKMEKFESHHPQTKGSKRKKHNT